MAEETKKRRGLVEASCALVNKYLPDAFIFAVLLTLVVFVAAIILNLVKATAPINFFVRVINLIKEGWYGGFWSLLAFTMEMAMVVVTGSILANTPPVRKGLAKLAALPKSPQMAVWLAAFVTDFIGWVNWGASLVVGAIFAKEIAKQIKGVHYALLVACGYLGLAVWHGGFSGSIPLQIAVAGKTIGAGSTTWTSPGIGFNQTIFSPSTIIASALCLIIFPLVMMKMHPTPEKTVTVDPSVFKGEESVADTYDRKTATPAVKLEHSVFLNYFIVGMAIIAMIMYFVVMGLKHAPFSVDLDFVNFLFLMASMALYKYPIYTVRAVAKVAAGAAGVMLQFPFYGGISGLMTFQGGASLSLAKMLSNAFVSISTTFSFPFWIFLSAGIINFFIPSGGGQWAVQGPIIMDAVQSPRFQINSFLGHPVTEAKAAMSVAWGDCWTNLIQPFWALPLLAVAKMQARDIMGYCVLMLFVEFVIVALCLLFLP